MKRKIGMVGQAGWLAQVGRAKQARGTEPMKCKGGLADTARQVGAAKHAGQQPRRCRGRRRLGPASPKRQGLALRGRQRRQGRFARQIVATAYHEAGHVAMAELLDVPYRSVSIVPAPAERGHVVLRSVPFPRQPNPFDPKLRARVEKTVMVLMAGFIAERELTGRGNNAGASSDQAATWELTSMVSFSEREQSLHLDALFARSAFLMRLPAIRSSVRTVADALLDYGTLTRRQATGIVTAAWKAVERRQRATQRRQVSRKSKVGSRK